MQHSAVSRPTQRIYRRVARYIVAVVVAVTAVATVRPVALGSADDGVDADPGPWITSIVPGV